MGKVSIGLRGWRFDEEDVFTEDGRWRPLEEMPPDVGERVQRLMAVVNSPCDACWLIHGDEHIEECNVSDVVYGEPMAEVTLCDDHEVDFLYWFREAGGSEHRGSEALQDAFHEWFADGGRAPDGYGGVEHVETDPDAVPDPETTAGRDAGAACDLPTAAEVAAGETDLDVEGVDAPPGDTPPGDAPRDDADGRGFDGSDADGDPVPGDPSPDDPT